MPKIRNKNSGNINKSGALTQTYKSYYKVNQEKYSFFKSEVNHSTFGNNIENVVFDDSKTILFVQKNLNPTLSLDDRHTNKLLSTPNTFPNESTVQTSVLRDKDYYNFSIKENHTENDYDIFDDSLIESSIEEKKENIVINFNRDPKRPIHLSTGFGGTSGSNVSSNNVVIQFPDTTAFKNVMNSHTAYLSQEEGLNCDYLGDTTDNMYLNVNTFLSTSIPFSGLTYSSNSADTPKALTNYNLPISDFGFPFDGKFRPKNRNIVKASTFIKKPFVVEKVILKTKVSNWAVSDVFSNALCLNFINFFVLNQRGRINSNSLTQQRTISRILNNTFDQNTIVNNNYDDETYTQKWTSFNTGLGSGNVWGKADISVENLSFDEPVKANQRELITNIIIQNYSANKLDHYLNSEGYISNDVDLLVDRSGESKINSNNFAECIYKDKSIEITSEVKNYKKNNNLPRFSKFEIYPSKKNSTRSNTEKRSERSLKNELGATENIGNGLVNSNTDPHDQIVRIYDPANSSNKEKNEYVIYPEDELIFGVNLATNYFPGGNDTLQQDYNALYGRDVVHINGNISFTLVGYYLERENQKVISHKNHFENKNMKRIGYSFNEVVDEFGQPEIYLSRGSYYDIAKPTGTAGNDFGNSAEYFSNRTPVAGVRKGSGFGNFLSLINSESLIIGRVSPLENYTILGLRYKENENSSYRHIKHYFRLDKFGQPAYKINNNRYIQHEDMSLNNKLNFFINKKYKKGLFIEKSLSSGDIFNSYNTTQRASYTDAQIAFKELGS